MKPQYITTIKSTRYFLPATIKNLLKENDEIIIKKQGEAEFLLLAVKKPYAFKIDIEKMEEEKK